jgi:L-cysteine:1D-myo-inositol 2-amino-2-deoxy-alpha-D-glucopyranoside ligase
MPVLEAVRARLADNLDAPAALSIVDEWAAATLAGDRSEKDAPGLVTDLVDALLGVALAPQD